MYTIEICGHCKFHRFVSGEWICSNPDSDMCALCTAYDDTCFDFEEK